MAVVLGVYYGFGLGEHPSSSPLFYEERQEQSARGETPAAQGTYRTAASASSSQDVLFPQQSLTTETRKRQADTEADITARSGELRQNGTQETELGQFTPSLLDAPSIEQAVKIEENRVIRIMVFVATAKKRKNLSES